MGGNSLLTDSPDLDRIREKGKEELSVTGLKERGKEALRHKRARKDDQKGEDKATKGRPAMECTLVDPLPTLPFVCSSGGWLFGLVQMEGCRWSVGRTSE